MYLNVERIKSVVGIEDVLADQGITLKQGRCHCPLHSGDNPTSFSVNNGLFHCFSCGESGDIITLTQKLYGMDFKEAIQYLTKRAGLSSDKYVTIKRKVDLRLGQRILERDLEKGVNDALVFLERTYIRMLRQLDRDLKNRKMSLSKYYSQRQRIEYRLEELDQFSIARNYEKNMRRKKKWEKAS